MTHSSRHESPSPPLPDEASELIERVYAALVDEEDARACQDIPEEACQVLPQSFLANTTAQAMTSFGDAIINPKSTLPWLLSALAAPGWAAALLVPLREAGSLLPQLAIAHWLRSMPRRKYAWMVGAVLQGTAVLAMAAAALTTKGAMFATLLLLAVAAFSLARGVCSVASKDVLGKTVAKRRRGRVSGYASSIAGVGTLLLASLLWLTGDAQAVPYVTLLACGGALWLLAVPVYNFIPEYAGATEGGASGLGEAVKRLSIVVDDREFRHYLLVRTLLLSTALVAPFFVFLARDQADVTLAGFLLAQGLAAMLAGPFWGRFADVSSRSVLMAAGCGAGLVGLMTALAAVKLPATAGSAWFFPLMFLLLAVLHDGVRLGRKTHVVDLAGGERRTDYVAVGNTITGAALLLLGALLAAAPLTITTKITVLSLFALAGAITARGLTEAQAT